MAGTKKIGEFRELISPFLKQKMSEIKNGFGEESAEYLSLAKQYITSPLESEKNSHQVPKQPTRKSRRISKLPAK